MFLDGITDLFKVFNLIFRIIIRFFTIIGNGFFYKKLDLFHILLLVFSADIHDILNFSIDNIIDSFKTIKRISVDDIGKTVLKSETIKLYHVNIQQFSFEDYFHRVIKFISHQLCNLPIQDIDNYWKSEKECYRMVETLFKIKLNQNKFAFYFNKSETFGNYSSVDYLNYMISCGLCAHLLESQLDGSYCVDLLFMKDYAVRTGLHKYGAKLHVSSDLTVNSIVIDSDPIYPTDSNWQYAFNVFISSLLAIITIRYHGCQSHLLFAGNMLYIHNTVSSLNQDLSRFLNVFLFNTSFINTNAYNLLVYPNGMVTRIFSFTQQSLEQFIVDSMDSFDFKKIITTIRSNTSSKALRDANKYLDIITELVTDFVETGDIMDSDYLIKVQELLPSLVDSQLTDKDNLINSLVYHIFNVSFWHEHIGNMMSYVLNAKTLKTKVYLSNLNADYATIQDSLQSIFLALQTSMIHVPTIDSDLYKTQDVKFHTIMKQFQINLKNLNNECDHLKPNIVECSVSL
jgi:hypothetical protein